MRFLAPLFVLLVRLSHSSPAVNGAQVEGDTFQLGMEMNSAAYRFTHSVESDRLAIEYLRVERKMNEALNKAWECASRCVTRGRVPSGLRREHILAVTAYTASKCSNFYAVFNQMLRTHGANDSIYVKFPFKSMHYLLSVVLERMTQNDHLPRTTYRGMGPRAMGHKGSTMRFGQFASSSLDSKVAKKFHGATLFTITSRLGAPIKDYSCYPYEEEVLIPPWEVFQITAFVERQGSVAITLRGVGRDDIPVKVEHDAGGEMLVVRSGADPMSSACALWLLAIMAPMAHASSA